MRPIVVRTFMLFSCLLIGVSCTRKVDSSKQKLSIQIPQSLRVPSSKIGGMSTGSEVLVHLVISIRENQFGGYEMAHYDWDACSYGYCSYWVPEYLDFDVESGDNRLIQILAVKSDPAGSSGMIFAYDDAVVNLNDAEVYVYMYPVDVTSGGSLKSFGGRYLGPGGDLYTGRVGMYLKPPSSSTRPPMKIMNLNMFSGYMAGMFPEAGGIGFFQYFIDDLGIPLFGGNAVSSSMFQPSQALLHVGTPNYWEVWNDNGYQNAHFAAATDGYYGYFGEGDVTGKTIQYDNSSMAIPYRYQNFDPVSGGTGAVYWNGSGATPSEAGPLAGGSPTASPTPSPDFFNTMVYNPTKIGEHETKQVGFNGPYINSTSSDNGINYSTTSTNVSVSWAYLPEVELGVNPITGTTVMWYFDTYGWLKMSDYDHDHHMPCDYFRWWFSTHYVPFGTSSYTIDLQGYPLSSLRVAVCPAQQIDYGGWTWENYFDFGVSHDFGGSGGGGGGPSNRLALSGPDTQHLSDCTIHTIDYLDYNKSPATTASDINFSISAEDMSSNPIMDFYDIADTACSTPVATFTILNGTSGISVRVKGRASNPGKLGHISVSTSDPTVYNYGGSVFGILPDSPGGLVNLQTGDINGSTVVGECSHGMVFGLDASSPTPQLTDNIGNIYLTGWDGSIPQPAYYHFYSDENCNTQISEPDPYVTIGAGESFKQFWYKALSNGDGTTGNPTSGFLCASTGVGCSYASPDHRTLYAQSYGDFVFHHFSIQPPLGGITIGACYSISLRSENAAGAELWGLGQINIVATSVGDEFFSTYADCLAGGGPDNMSLSIGAYGSQTQTFYLKPGSTQGANHTMTYSGTYNGNLIFPPPPPL